MVGGSADVDANPLFALSSLTVTTNNVQWGDFFQSAKNSLYLYLYLHLYSCACFSLFFLTVTTSIAYLGDLFFSPKNPFVLVFVLLLSLLGEFCCFFYLSSFHCLYFSVPKNSVVSWICICVCVCDDIVIGCEKNTPCV